MPTIEETLEFIKKAHEGQVDKGGRPYWEHPYRVMLNLPKDAPEDWKHAALLHDILEDTEYTSNDLFSMGYSSTVEFYVLVLTHTKGDCTYFEYIQGIREAHREHPGILAIKIADVMDNLDPERLARIPKGGDSLKGRYMKTLDILLGKLDLDK